MFVFIGMLLFAGPDPESAAIGARRMVRQIEAVLAEEAFAEGFWGLVVYAPARGEFLFTRNARRAFRPASNMKILTTLLAFDELGPEYRFVTSFNRTGPVREGVLAGDLVIRGRGDPSISGTYGAATTAELLAEVTAALRHEGIHEIRGDLVGVTGFFDERPLADSWEWFDVGTGYGTPVGPLVLNDGRLELHLTTDEDGMLTAAVVPERTPDFTLELRVTHEPGFEDLNIAQQWGSNHFLLSGNMPRCSERTLVRSVWDPASQFLVELRHALRQAGIGFDGRLRTVTARDAADEQSVHGFVSPTLALLARVLMKYSQNHYADLFLKTVAAELSGEGSFAAGEALATGFFGRISADDTLARGLSMRDGSGLSAQNYLTPAQIVALLRHGLAQPYRRAWLTTFPVMGRDGTLEERGDDRTAGRVWAKTGYIYRTRCLSGYLETNAGEPLIFSMMVNNYHCSTAEVNRAQDRLCALLLRLKPNRAVHRSGAHRLLSRILAGPAERSLD